MIEQVVALPPLDAYQRAVAAGRRVWGADWSAMLVARAPGRLELLGNHIDYNGGPVLAAAIDRNVVCLLSETVEPGISLLLADVATEPERLDPAQLREWTRHGPGQSPSDYIRGAIAVGLANGATVRTGVRLVIAGDVPVGFGLSSSAALCVAVTLALHDPLPDGRELVLRAQAAEHRAGTPCGTMDQSASVGGNVILYDGATVSWQSISPDLGEFVFAVADSGVARSLSTSSYPRRVEESHEALAIANRMLGTNHVNLADFSKGELDVVSRGARDMPEPLIKRIRHVVTETERVRLGVSAMRSGDWRAFGKLMIESGASSAIDYEISHPAVEEIVSIAIAVPGVLGTRMMGGGEGGVALVLLHRDAVGHLMERLDDRFYRSRGMIAEDAVRVFQFAPGASVQSPAATG